MSLWEIAHIDHRSDIGALLGKSGRDHNVLHPSQCGRIGPYVHRGIRRYSEKEGGDYKITCAGAPDAHDKAIDFILQSIGEGA